MKLMQFSSKRGTQYLKDSLKYACACAQSKGNTKRQIVEALLEVLCEKLVAYDPYCSDRQWVVDRLNSLCSEHMLDSWAEQICTGAVYGEEDS
jgi:hypothetical protein